MAPFEQAQLATNQGKFSGDLATIAGPWLPHVAGCGKDQARPADGEETRMLCRYGNANIFFVEYRSTDERDKARTRYLAQNIDAKQLTPGVTEGSAKRKTTSGKADGDYLEFAFKNSPDANARVVSGVWWDNSATPVGVFILAFWDDIGQKWEPLRDVWRRYA